MLYTQEQIRDCLIQAGADTSPDPRRPAQAEILAAVALASSAVQGRADFAKRDGNRVTCFQIDTRPEDDGRMTPRDRLWITRTLLDACLAGVALTRMNGWTMWPQCVSGAYKAYLPEAYPPRIIRRDGEIPYQECTVLYGYSLLHMLRICGWIAPSRADADAVARRNGLASAAAVIPGQRIRIPVQRGW